MDNSSGINARQLRAARALLDWSQSELALASGVCEVTIRKLELGQTSPRSGTMKAISTTLESAGLEFIEPDGVRTKPNNIAIYQGLSCGETFLSNVRETIRQQGGEICVVVAADISAHSARSFQEFAQKLGEILLVNETARIKCLVSEAGIAAFGGSRFETRYLPRSYVDPMPFYVFGDKHAVLVPSKTSAPTIMVVQSLGAVEKAICHFKSLWDKARALETAAVLTSPRVRVSSFAIGRSSHASALMQPQKKQAGAVKNTTTPYYSENR